jgi:hypothetical protein
MNGHANEIIVQHVMNDILKSTEYVKKIIIEYVIMKVHIQKNWKTEQLNDILKILIYVILEVLKEQHKVQQTQIN